MVAKATKDRNEESKVVTSIVICEATNEVRMEGFSLEI